MMMRFPILIPFLLLGTSTTVSARACGTAITDECKADSDIRYDPKVPTDLKTTPGGLAWERISGLYFGELSRYNPDTYEKILLSEDEKL